MSQTMDSVRMVPKKRLRTKKELQQGYNEESTTYDATRFGSSGGRYLDGLEKLAFSRSLVKHSVLELGTGTGRYGVFLSRKGYAFVGIDIAKNMLSVAKKKALREGLDARFVMADAENLPFRDEKFDNVICVHTFQYLPHPVKVLNGSRKILKKGGRCIVSFENDSLFQGKFRTHFRTPSQNFYKSSDVKVLFEKAGLNPTHQRSLIILPPGLYQRLPKILIKIIGVFDKRLNAGCISIICGERLKTPT